MLLEQFRWQVDELKFSRYPDAHPPHSPGKRQLLQLGSEHTGSQMVLSADSLYPVKQLAHYIEDEHFMQYLILHYFIENSHKKVLRFRS